LILTALIAITGVVVVQSLPSDARADTTTQAGSLEVRSVAIDGLELPLAQLRGQLQTRVGTTVDTARLERDRRAMQQYLEGRGYLAARVESPTVTLAADGAYVVFDIERGPLYRVRRLTLDGPRWAEAGVVTLAAGDEAIAERFARARRDAEATLNRRGKSVVVDLVVISDPVQPVVDVTLATR
jgi:hypothetical protein